jgi:hypothetical protein
MVVWMDTWSFANLCHEFIKELDDFEKFNNYLDYWEHMK